MLKLVLTHDVLALLDCKMSAKVNARVYIVGEGWSNWMTAKVYPDSTLTTADAAWQVCRELKLQSTSVVVGIGPIKWARRITNGIAVIKQGKRLSLLHWKSVTSSKVK